jgi:hypothetical protein
MSQMFLSSLLTTALALSTAVVAAPSSNGNKANNNGHGIGLDKNKKNANNGTCPLTAVDPVEFPYPSKSSLPVKTVGRAGHRI